jgi:hypothetical protein
MKHYIKFKYSLNESLELFYCKIKNLLYMKSSMGLVYIYMPKLFFFVKKNESFNFLFINKYYFYSIFKQVLNLYKFLFKFYFFILRLRGLGYKVYQITKKLFKFFFAFNHYYYLHIPIDIFLVRRRKKFFFFSNNLAKLNDLYSHLILLKKIDFYERTNTFIIPRKIVYIKKRKQQK